MPDENWLDFILGKIFQQWWPVMAASPGMTMGLLLIGAVVGGAIIWWLRGHIVRDRIETLKERVSVAKENAEVADRHKLHAESRLLEASTKQSGFSDQIQLLTAHVSNLGRLIEGGAKQDLIAAESASTRAVGSQIRGVMGLAMAAPISVDWCGYWQRAQH